MDNKICYFSSELNKNILSSDIYKTYIRLKNEVYESLGSTISDFNKLKVESLSITPKTPAFYENVSSLTKLKETLDNNILYKKYIQAKNECYEYLDNILIQITTTISPQIKIRKARGFII
ncbi:MAG: YlbF family regulator [Acholeplasmatales bacterium]|jgi:cell fate (sporulation/competence/biofilm development) regulator YlbF (YheA/YmcA/DUF963 family)|nr:YlbF family regulator [Acholeplasmatales bacterium]